MAGQVVDIKSEGQEVGGAAEGNSGVGQAAGWGGLGLGSGWWNDKYLGGSGAKGEGGELLQWCKAGERVKLAY